MKKPSKPVPGCTLPTQENNCGTHNCMECGWYIKNKIKHEEELNNGGLTMCDDGLKRLIQLKRG